METNNLFEQMAQISKSSAYDIVAKQRDELKQTMRELIAFGELEDLEFTEPATTAAFKQLIQKAKIQSL